MKKLLLVLVTFVAISFVYAQNSCSGAVSITGLPTTDYTQGCVTATTSDGTLSTVNGSTSGGCGAVVEEYWFTFTIPAGLPNYQIDLINSTANRNIGFQLMNGTTGCSATAWTGNVITCQNATGNGGNETYTMYDMPAGTYYIRILSYQTNNVDFDLCFTYLPDPPANDNPCGAINVPVGANGVCSTVVASNVGATATAGPAAPSCTLGYSGGDVWYSVTVPASGNITFATDYATPTATITDNGIAVYSGTCGGTLTEIGCDDDSGNGLMASLSLTGLTPGATLYVRAWEYGNNVSGTFNLCFSEPPVSDVNQDCNTANQLCSDATLSGASNGSGSVSDLTAANQDCLSTENESNWYFMVVTTAGLLEFNVSPANGSDDYDFAVWRYPNGVGQTCPPSGNPDRCSFAAGSGLNSSYDTGLGQGATDASEDVSGDNWVQGMNCSVGDIVVLLVDNFSSTTSPFTLDFTGNVGLSCVPGSLPVTLLNINGVRENGLNKISWHTQSEINSDFYRVEELINGEWMLLTNTSSKGGDYINDYVVFDENFDRIATNYYRVIQVDTDGKETMLGVVAIQAEADFSDVVLAPNPAKDQLTVSLNALAETDCELTIVDMSGKVLATKTVNTQHGANTFAMDVTAFDQGSYMMVVRTENTTYRKSFMK